MRAAAIFSGLMLSLAAGSALACPQPGRCDRTAHEAFDDPDGDYDERHYDDGARQDRYGPGPGEAYDAPGVWEDERGLYMHGNRGMGCDCAPPPPCGCAAGELTLASSFFYDGGGAGPIPDGGYYGGGYYVAAGGGSSAHAFAGASARASAGASVRRRGGHMGR